MKTNLLRKLFFSTTLWFFAFVVVLAQTPEADIDSITEDSYKRMLERQAIEKSEIANPIFVAPSYDSKLETYTIDDVPSPRGEGIIGSISDPKGYLDFGSTRRINELLYELERKSSVEVAVVMLPSIGNEVPKDFAVKLFERWGIGKSDTDNGLLILTIMDQRRTEFEVGNGLEPILTDVVCYRIGTDEIVPHFKNGDYGAGMSSAVERVKQFLEDPAAIEEIYSNEISYQDNKALKLIGIVSLVLSPYFLLCLILAFWFYGVAFDIERSKDDYYDKYHRLDKLKFGCLQFLFPLPMLFFAKMAKNRLKRYRNAPRFSKKNGLSMTLLTNYDEIEFLEEVQLLEEELKSILYDVWITDDKSDIMILEYEGPNGRDYTNCQECSYKTFGKLSSLILVAATYDHGGTRIDKYECRNCNYQEEKEINIPMKSRPSESSSGSSFSSSSSSSSSSSFGGGSSGGGGSGVSW